MSEALAPCFGYEESLGDRARALLYSLGIHLAAAALVLVGVWWSASTPIEPAGDPTVQAFIADLPRAPPPRPAPPTPRRTEPERPRPVPVPQTPRPTPPEARQDDVTDQRPTPPPAPVEDPLAAAQEQERLRRLEEEQRRAQLEEVRRQRELAEQARRQEEQRLAELREQQRRREEAERRAEEERLRAQMLAEEERRLAGQRETDDLRAQYASLIQQVVTQNWRRPQNTPPGVRCALRVIQVPGGSVLSASIASPCNADPITQQSLIEAVQRASPLPYQGFERVFTRDLTFIFTYQG